MALLGSLQVRMGLNAAEFQKGFRSFQRDLKKGVGRFQRSLRGLTSVGSLGGGFAAGLGLKSLIQTAGDFEAQMNGVRAVMSGLSAGEFSELTKKAKELGETTKFSAIESASAIEVLAKNGLKVGDIMGGALDASLLLAASTGSEIPEAADLATDAMLIFGKSAADLGTVVNRINGVMINSKFGFEDYRNALAAGGPAARKAGKELEEFNATIGATASFFASGETAGTAFKVFTDKLVNDSSAAAAAQEKLGVSFFNAAGEMRSMGEIAEGLKDGLAGLSDEEAIRSLVDQFGTRGANFAVALAKAGKEGIETQKALQGQADAAAQAATRMEGMAGAAKRAASAFEGLKLKIAEGGLLESVTSLLGKATELAGWLGKLPKPVLNTGIALTALVAAAGPVAFGLSSIAGVIPVITSAAGAMGSGLLSLTGPVGLLAAALVGAGVLIYQNWETVKAAVLAVVEGIVGFFRKWATENAGLLQGIAEKAIAFKDSFVRVFLALTAGIGENVVKIATWLNSVLEPIGGLKGAFEGLKVVVGFTMNAIGTIVGATFGALAAILNEVADVLTGQKTIWESLGDTIKRVVIASAAFVKTKFAEMVEFLKSIDLKQIGRDILNGLFAGLKASAGAILNWVEDFADSISDSFMAAMQMGSPSKLFRRFGNWIMQGLGIGISEEEKVATKAMESAASAVIAAGQNGDAAAGVEGLLKVSGKEVKAAGNVFTGVFQRFTAGLGQAIKKGKDGFKELGKTLIDEVGRKALDQVTANFSKILTSGGGILKSVAGLFGGGGSGGNLIGSILGAFTSFSGGGHTGNGPRTGGLDGQGGYLAMVHPQETIIDETKPASILSKRREAGGVSVTNHFTIAPGVTREELNIAMEEAERQRQREERRRYDVGDPSMARLVY